MALRAIPKYRLGGYLLLPTLVAFVLLAVVLAMSFYFIPNFSTLIIGDGIGLFEGSNWIASASNWVIEKINSASGVIAGILSMLIFIIFFKNILQVVLSPFLSPLSEKVETKLTGDMVSSPPFWSTLWRGASVAIGNIVRELFYLIPLLILGLFPLFSIPSLVLVFLVQAYYAGAGNIDYCLERHLNRKESKRFIKKHRWYTIGNGAIFLLLVGTGIGILFAPTLATIAGTIGTVERLDE